MDCPFCIPEVHQMVGGKASTNEIEKGFHLTCQSCGFSMTASSLALFINAQDTLWKYYPDNEAV